MTKFWALLVISAVQITTVNAIFSINEILDNLRDGGKMLYNLTMDYEPAEIPITVAVDNMRNQIAGIYEERIQPGDRYSILIAELRDVLYYEYKSHELHSEMIDFIVDTFYIFSEYHDFKVFINSTDAYNITKMDKFMLKFLKNDTIQPVLEILHQLVLGNSKLNFFFYVRRYIENYVHSTCSGRMIDQSHVEALYHLILKTEERGIFMIITALAHLTRRQHDNYHSRIESTMRKAKKRLRSYMIATRQILEKIPTEVIACNNRTIAKNYTTLYGMTQGFIIESGGSKSVGEDCQLNAPENDFCTSHPEECFGHKCLSLGGRLTGCRNLHSTKLQVCDANESSRLYSWIKSEEMTYGNYASEEECLEPGSEKTSESPSFCFCKCEREKWRPGDIRAISLHQKHSDYHHNRIITNLMFEEKNGLIQLKIEEGEILPGGMINQSSLEWGEESFPYPVSSNVTKSPEYIFNDSFIDDGKPLKWSEGKHFAYISNDLTINLDDIVAPVNHVIISVGLQLGPESKPSAVTIELEVKTMEFNHTSGSLNHDSIKTITGTSALESKLGKIERERVNLGAPGHPVMSKQKNDIISKPFQFVKFQQTDWKKDLGQTIVPLIDTRPVVDGRSLAISGVGLYFRGCEKDCGGFIAPKLFTYNYTHHFELPFRKSYIPGEF